MHRALFPEGCICELFPLQCNGDVFIEPAEYVSVSTGASKSKDIAVGLQAEQAPGCLLYRMLSACGGSMGTFKNQVMSVDMPITIPQAADVMAFKMRRQDRIGESEALPRDNAIAPQATHKRLTIDLQIDTRPLTRGSVLKRSIALQTGANPFQNITVAGMQAEAQAAIGFVVGDGTIRSNKAEDIGFFFGVDHREIRLVDDMDGTGACIGYVPFSAPPPDGVATDAQLPSNGLVIHGQAQTRQGVTVCGWRCSASISQAIQACPFPNGARSNAIHGANVFAGMGFAQGDKRSNIRTNTTHTVPFSSKGL